MYPFLVKRLIGVPGDHIHLRNGVVILNGVAQNPPKDSKERRDPSDKEFLDEFPSVPPAHGPKRHRSVGCRVSQSHRERRSGRSSRQLLHDGRSIATTASIRATGDLFRAKISSGRPLFNYWSFKTPEDQYEQTGIGNSVAWMGHVALHFFTDTRWKRTLHLIQ